MLTKNQIKLIKSLNDKKNRVELGLFLVEGEKSVLELLKSNFEIESLLITTDFLEKNKKQIESKIKKYELLDKNDLEKIGTLESNDSAIAVVKQKINNIENIDFTANKIILALDDIRDPGNLGTIIRIADWYGIKNIIASANTVDFYNPKVITATKGSFSRINIFYTDLKKFLSETKLPILGAFLEGENIHKKIFPDKGILLMGNESNGISPDIEKLVTQKITIPSYGEAESLNVAIATAVILDNWVK